MHKIITRIKADIKDGRRWGKARILWSSRYKPVKAVGRGCDTRLGPHSWLGGCVAGSWPDPVALNEKRLECISVHERSVRCVLPSATVLLWNSALRLYLLHYFLPLSIFYYRPQRLNLDTWPVRWDLLILTTCDKGASTLTWRTIALNVLAAKAIFDTGLKRCSYHQCCVHSIRTRCLKWIPRVWGCF